MTRRAPGGPIRLDELARACGACVEGDGATPIERVATLEGAGPGDLAFLANPRYRAQLAATRASAVIVAPAAAQLTPLPRLVAADPYVAYAKAASVLYPREAPLAGRHPAAIVDPAATVAATAAIGPLAVVGAGASIGARASIGSHCSIGEDAVIGDDAVLDAGVRVYPRCTIGPRTLVHSGAVIGADGFGLAPGPEGWIKIPQVGRVVVGADVEIGANTTIDRGAIGDTVIEDGVKLDNQIQIGHNCVIGARTAIAGCVGIAGSARIGHDCRIGGAAMISGHLEIAAGTVVSAATLVSESIAVAGVYTGAFPALAHADWKRVIANVRHLRELVARVRALERPRGRDRGPNDGGTSR
ncbi:MAG: UDP-3-O-(3-hydroxymyristoyl)glucosamine N-acyltransferase [Proteobacteria bacterium]|jgi:UDP-3-O-[3-hydroxymyristoyl] glucosamine N-acyltransferase|nr:UDP-3-O-(3-hydroxymyristoyl)glucosamine N-acyltransferase [Pseudomonadota bacterium]